MAQTVIITLTAAGADTGPFDLYSNVDGYLSPFDVSVPKAPLLTGYTSTTVHDSALIIRVVSTSGCTNHVDLPIETTTSTTTTNTSSTTSSSTTAVPGIGFQAQFANILVVCGSTPTTVYTADGTITYGEVVYVDAGLTTPLTGYTYISDYSIGIVHHLNVTTGLIGTNAGYNC